MKINSSGLIFIFILKIWYDQSGRRQAAERGQKHSPLNSVKPPTTCILNILGKFSQTAALQFFPSLISFFYRPSCWKSCAFDSHNKAADLSALNWRQMLLFCYTLSVFEKAFQYYMKQPTSTLTLQRLSVRCACICAWVHALVWVRRERERELCLQKAGRGILKTRP